MIHGLLAGAYPKPIVRIEGYAGSGKSTILPFILEKLGFDPFRVSFLAPTGKAAKVMRKKLSAQNFPNPIATTIHSAIYRAKPAPVAQLEDELEKHQIDLSMAKIDLGIAKAEGGDVGAQERLIEKLTRAVARLQADLHNLYLEDKISFQLNVDSPLAQSQLIVIDEGSMVGKMMAGDLGYFNVPILVMGDPGQLPPVGDDPGLLVGTPDFFLSEVHRQAAENPIIKLATLARKGRELPYGDYHDPDGILRAQVVRRRDWDPDSLIEKARLSLEEDEDANLPQVLVGTNRTRYRITQMFREGLPKGPTKNEPLIVRKNSKEHPALVNGALAKCLSDEVNLKDGDVVCRMSFMDEEGASYENMRVFQGLFEDHHAGQKNSFTADSRSAYRAKQSSIHLDFGWALTVHNAQGSQWDHVVLVDESSVFKEDCDKHLYTGITRAAETLTILV